MNEEMSVEHAKKIVLESYPNAICNPYLGEWRIYKNDREERQIDAIGDGESEGAAWLDASQNLHSGKG